MIIIIKMKKIVRKTKLTKCRYLCQYLLEINMLKVQLIDMRFIEIRSSKIKKSVSTFISVTLILIDTPLLFYSLLAFNI